MLRLGRGCWQLDGCFSQDLLELTVPSVARRLLDDWDKSLNSNFIDDFLKVVVDPRKFNVVFEHPAGDGIPDLLFQLCLGCSWSCSSAHFKSKVDCDRACMSPFPLLEVASAELFALDDQSNLPEVCDW